MAIPTPLRVRAGVSAMAGEIPVTVVSIMATSFRLLT